VLGALGCSSAATTKIGTACKTNGDCNVKGQSCVAGLVGGMPTGPKICTHPCTSEYGDNGCPIGFDCNVSDTSIGLTCNKAPYTVDPTTGTPSLFGKTCAMDSDCMGTGDPNTAPSCRHALDPTTVFAIFGPQCKTNMDCANILETLSAVCFNGQCYRSGSDPCVANNVTCPTTPVRQTCRAGTCSPPIKPLAQDPAAYCTGTCVADSDCPIGFACLADFDNLTNDKSQYKCIKRSVCDPCTIDANCPLDFPVCVPDKNGGHYCSKACNTDNDCPGGAASADNSYRNYMSCLVGQDADGNAGKFCFDYYGACNGAGAICDPCRGEFDCKNGAHCLINTQSFERFCTAVCSGDTSCAGPNMATCDNTSATMSSGLCTGDTAKINPGILSCHL
jgi:hypothetical protein